MTHQGPGIGKGVINLRGSLECRDGLIVLSAQTESIADSHPPLWSGVIGFRKVMTEEGQGGLAFQVPKDSAVDVHVFYPRWLQLEDPGKALLGGLVVGAFIMGLAQLCKDSRSVSLRGWKCAESTDSERSVEAGGAVDSQRKVTEGIENGYE